MTFGLSDNEESKHWGHATGFREEVLFNRKTPLPQHRQIFQDRAGWPRRTSDMNQSDAHREVIFSFKHYSVV